jgi:GNAT superfamily N-acetyltransferase
LIEPSQGFADDEVQRGNSLLGAEQQVGLNTMATARIDVVGQEEIPLVAQLYGQVFRPAHEAEFFRRRFLGRYNPLLLIASMDQTPVGFFVGFELKPGVFFAWLYGVLPDCRRQGIASQLMSAAHAWAAQQGYETMRFECHNQHRAMLHLAIEQQYDIVGLRYDSDRQANLVIVEKSLAESE